jgi:hypothetical protein
LRKDVANLCVWAFFAVALGASEIRGCDCTRERLGSQSELLSASYPPGKSDPAVERNLMVRYTAFIRV